MHTLIINQCKCLNTELKSTNNGDRKVIELSATNSN